MLLMTMSPFMMMPFGKRGCCLGSILSHYLIEEYLVFQVVDHAHQSVQLFLPQYYLIILSLDLVWFLLTVAFFNLSQALLLWGVLINSLRNSFILSFLLPKFSLLLQLDLQVDHFTFRCGYLLSYLLGYLLMVNCVIGALVELGLCF